MHGIVYCGGADAGRQACGVGELGRDYVGWDLETGNLWQRSVPISAVQTAAVETDGRTIVAGDDDESISSG